MKAQIVIFLYLLTIVGYGQVPSKSEAKEYKSFNPWGLSVKQQFNLIEESRGRSFLSIGSNQYLFVTASGSGVTRDKAREESYGWSLANLAEEVGKILSDSIDKQLGSKAKESRYGVFRSGIRGSEISIESKTSFENGQRTSMFSKVQKMEYFLSLSEVLKDGVRDKEFKRSGFPMHLVEKVVHMYTYDDQANHFRAVCALAMDLGKLQIFLEPEVPEFDWDLQQIETEDLDDLGDWD